jgi:hypothetical protein
LGLAAAGSLPKKSQALLLGVSNSFIKGRICFYVFICID